MTNQGPGERSGVMNSVVDALRTSPLTLGLIVLVVIFMYYSTTALNKQREQTHEILKVLLERCGPQRSSIETNRETVP